MPPAATYALLALCAATLLFGFWVDGREPASRLGRLRRYSLALQLGAVLGAYLVLRRPADARAGRAVAEGLAAGRPVLLDLYSNY